MSTQSIVFPADRMPDDPHHARLLGLYPQRQQGLWMQRVKVLGGRLTGPQWRRLARIAKQFTPGTPLHLTTRQDVEIHDLTGTDVPAVHRALQEVGLTTLGACGDTLRNITVCPCSGTGPETPDLAPLAWRIRHLLEAQPDIHALPRKFKVSLSACPRACGQPWINDMGFVAIRRDGRWGFQAIGAGSLGARPQTGTMLSEWLPAEHVPPLVLAAIRVFAAHGDRRNRQKARLRHVRQRMGDAPFLALLRETFEAVLAEGPWPAVPIDAPTEAFLAQATLTFANGDLASEHAEALADVAERPGLLVRLSTQQRVIVFGRDETALAAALDSHAALSAARVPQPLVVACPGRRWCSRALTDTQDVAERIRLELADRLSAEQTVCISGCPNGCAHSAVADIGLVGVLTTRDGVQQQACHILLGGRMGRGPEMAQPAASRVPTDELAAHLRHQFERLEAQRLAAQPHAASEGA